MVRTDETLLSQHHSTNEATAIHLHTDSIFTDQTFKNISTDEETSRRTRDRFDSAATQGPPPARPSSARPGPADPSWSMLLRHKLSSAWRTDAGRRHVSGVPVEGSLGSRDYGPVWFGCGFLKIGVKNLL